MNKKYWLVKLILGGFETTIGLYGSEAEVRDYIQKNFSGPLGYVELSEQDAVFFMQSIKFYVCPPVKDAENSVNETSVEV